MMVLFCQRALPLLVATVLISFSSLHGVHAQKAVCIVAASIQDASSDPTLSDYERWLISEGDKLDSASDTEGKSSKGSKRGEGKYDESKSSKGKGSKDDKQEYERTCEDFKLCGNEITDKHIFEQCDNGKSNGSGDSDCDKNCQFKCGNGINEPGEDCNPNLNRRDSKLCTEECKLVKLLMR